MFYYDINNKDFDFKEVLNSKGPVFVHLKVNPGNANVPVIPLEATKIKNRFMDEIKRK